MKPRTKKVLAEIVAGMIPFRRERDRWRGILRYGPWRALRLSRRLRHDHTTPPYYLAICAIAKNEGPYFDEWITWHRSKGVDKFYIYDNESDDNTASVLAPYIEEGIVEYLYWPGKKQQIPVYDACIDAHRFDTRWMAFLDLDEFIVPLKDDSIPQYLKRMEQYPAVEISWLVYGSGGEKSQRAGGVMERFKYHAHPDYEANRHVKSVVDPRKVCCMRGCHEPAWLPGTGYPVDSSGAEIKTTQHKRPPVHEAIRINHYAVKSREEFEAKKSRGRADALSLRDEAYFTRFDRNDIKE